MLIVAPTLSFPPLSDSSQSQIKFPLNWNIFFWRRQGDISMSSGEGLTLSVDCVFAGHLLTYQIVSRYAQRFMRNKLVRDLSIREEAEGSSACLVI